MSEAIKESVLNINTFTEELFKSLQATNGNFQYGGSPAFFNDLLFDFNATYKVVKIEYMHRIPGTSNSSTQEIFEKGIQSLCDKIIEYEFGQNKPILLNGMSALLNITDLSLPFLFSATFLVKQ